MKLKILLLVILVLALFVSGCMRPVDMKCNYDGVCDEWETDDCPDCIDVLGRGVQELPSKSAVDEADYSE